MTIRNYDDLSAYVRSHASDPLRLAKVLTAWEWTSWNPWSDPVAGPAKSVYDLDRVMHGACGWRMILLGSLFSEIGVKFRYVDLYNVAVQGGHNAIELFINGKWMFFDGTFGIYFEKNGVPLSLEEARANWPQVTVKQSNLPGWTGTRMDLDAIDPSKVFSNKTDLFFEHPGLTDRIDDISGEIHTLFLSRNAYYREDGTGPEIAYESGGRRWNVRYDKTKDVPWSQVVTFYDSHGKRDTQHTTYDNKDERFTFWDTQNTFDWSKRTTYTHDNFYVYYDETIYDDKSRVIKEYDGRRQYDWQEKTTYYARTGALLQSKIKYDDGRVWSHAADGTNGTSWDSIEHSFTSGGILAATFIKYDNGAVVNLNWSDAAYQVANPGSSTLIAGAGHNFLQGSGASDVLIGGQSEDLLAGGGGNDIYYVSHSGAVVFEKEGEGVDTVNSSINFVLPENVENLYLTGSAIIGVGNDGMSNLLFGNGEDNILRGLSGDDTLIGGAGSDRLEGGKGNDVYYIDQASDVVYERAREGIDTVNTTVSFKLPNYVENLFLMSGATVGIGNRENNLLMGNDKDNVLKGLGGNDTLFGGKGKDVLYGNGGADQFVWRSLEETGKGSSADNVRDFDFAAGDRLNISKIDANSLVAGRQHFDFIGMGSPALPGQIGYTYSGGKTIIHLNTDYDPLDEGTIVLDGLHNPSANWFAL